MRITGLDSRLLRVPLARPVTGRIDHATLLLVHLGTDAEHQGLGFTGTIEGGGRALQALLEDDLTPLLIGEDPLNHERLLGKVSWHLRGLGRRGLLAQAYAAVDLALWDLKGKAAGLPLYKLLGGARDAAPAFASDAGWLWMSAEEILTAARPYLEQGLPGISIQVGSGDPEADAERVQEVRGALGDDTWLAVEAGQRYDLATALAMGRFFLDEIGVDWFGEPIPTDDLAGHARLARKLDMPLAVGGALFGIEEFRRYLHRGAAGVLRPDVLRLGGLTPLLELATLARGRHRPLVPHRLPEVGVHLACGLPQVTMVEYLPWFFPVWKEPPRLAGGELVPPARPGLGLEVNEEAVEQFTLT